MQDADRWEDTISHFLLTKRYGKNSVSVIEYILHAHLRWVSQQGLEPDSITPPQILRYLQELEQMGRSPNTVVHHFGTLSRYYRWLVGQELVVVDPTADFPSPKVSMNVRDTFSVEELKALWSATASSYERSIVGLLGINALSPMMLRMRL
ncbi:phage integrase N-terminal SAM-like domain-containing protein [Arthrobacter sp. Rue61a]|uniref:tyrosine-type recombinase/integrase n=1 Tax=Arthrobacter sp. Rue61a TaxID=1118963 RepID=UPI00027DF499|nr:phage integrase N-terminal SAM-like domain-containing protein [Arthrobacter sp. Rue61a]AFR31402.1 putative recombinase [Arthrobacter sp. Rue61a]